jgi:two-component system, NarL family, response regulator DevR
MNAAPARPIRLALVDDSELVRLGLHTLLGLHATKIMIVAEAGSIAEAVKRIPPALPDVILLDMRLPDGTGVSACRQLLAAHPAKILFLTSSLDDALIADAIRAGASGYLLKEINGEELVRSIMEVAAGGEALDAAVTASLMRTMRASPGGPASVDPVTANERRMLAMLAEGKTNKEIANEFGLAEKTIKNNFTALFSKLGLVRRSQAAAFYVQHLSR